MAAPAQYTTADGTLDGALNESNRTFVMDPAPIRVTSDWIFRNGVFMTEPLDVVALNSVIQLSREQTPVSDDIITAAAWVPSALASEPALNTGTQFSSLYGSIAGDIDGENNTFTLVLPQNTVGNGLTIPFAEMMLFRNGVCQQPDGDYRLNVNTITFLSESIPQLGDILTAQVFFD